MCSESLSSLLKLLLLLFFYLQKKTVKVTQLIGILCGKNRLIYRKHSEKCLEYSRVLSKGYPSLPQLHHLVGMFQPSLLNTA